MKILYALGIFAASLILIQLEALLIVSLYVVCWYMDLELIGQLSCILFATILIIAHVLTTYNSVNHIDNTEIDLNGMLENLYQKNQLINHPINLGFAWRIINEWRNIKKVANLDFQTKENSVS